MTELRWILTPDNRRKMMEFAWAKVKDMTEPMELVIRPAKSKRSQEQLRRQWKLYREMSAIIWTPGEDGTMRQYSPEVWHEYMARMFIGSEDLPDGSTKALSTANLSVAEFTEYMTQIEAWCAQEGYQVMEGGA